LAAAVTLLQQDLKAFVCGCRTMTSYARYQQQHMVAQS